MDVLVVVDMQNDFIDGSLGTQEAQAIVPRVVEKVSRFSGRVVFTRDTHEEDYLNTQEGRNLPVAHCIRGTDGWQICAPLKPYCAEVVDKPTFGSVALAEMLQKENQKTPIERITLIGLCTDICVIANAMLLKAFLPETRIAVDAACCAGVMPESHEQALGAMKQCQIEIERA